MTKTLIMLFIILVLACVKNPDRVSGTISETDTGCVIEGWVKYSDNKNVLNAEVILHLQRSVISINAKTHSPSAPSEKTDSLGFFKFDSVSKGKYLIEIHDNNSQGAIVPISVEPLDTLIKIKAYVTQLGCIIGKIDTTNIHVKINTILYMPEINKIVHFDSTGFFIISELPEWRYQIRIAVNDTIISLPSDSILVSVTAGDTARIDNFSSRKGSVLMNGEIIENPNTF
jgi:hypothetical protein